MTATLGSLCSGYGGLELGVAMVRGNALLGRVVLENTE